MFKKNIFLKVIFLVIVIEEELRGQKMEFEKNYQKFYINEKDLISINVDLFLPEGRLLNDLQIKNTKNLEIKIPNFYQKEIFEDNDKTEDFFHNIIENTSFNNKKAFLYKNKKEEMIIRKKEINLKNKSILNKDFFFAPKEIICKRVLMDEKYTYAACISTLELNYQFCKKNYKDDFAPNCESFDFGYTLTDKIEDEKPTFQLFKKKEKNLFAFYISNSKFDKSSNIFYLFDEEFHGKFEINEDLKIKKIRIINYNPITKRINLLILVRNTTLKMNQLRYYEISSMKFSKTNKIIKEDLDDFLFENNSLVFLKQNQNAIEIYDVDLSDLSYGTFYLENQKKIRKTYMQNNFIIFEIFDEVDEIDIFILDLENKRFFKIDDIERKTISKEILKSSTTINLDFLLNDSIQGNLFTVLVTINLQTYFLEFQNGITTVFELNRFKYIDVKYNKKTGDFIEKIDFEFNTEKYTLNFDYKKFDFIKNNIGDDVLNFNLQRGIDEHRLDIFGNNLNFSEEKNLLFFNEVTLNYQDEKNLTTCTLLKAHLKDNNFIKICKENYIVIFSKYRFFKKIYFDLSYKIVLKLDFDVHNISLVKLIYEKFLIFLTHDNNFLFLNLELKKPILKEIKILQNYSNCLLEKGFFICEDIDKTHGVFLIKYNIENLELVFIKNIDIPNAIPDSFIIPNFDIDKLIYLAKNNDNKEQIYLESFKDNKKKKMITNYNFENTILFEIYAFEYLGIKNIEENYNLFLIIEKNIVQMPDFINSNIKEILDIKILQNKKVFAILYISKKNQTRLFIGRSSLLIYHRVIKDIEVFPYEEINLNLEMDTVKHRIFIYIYDNQSDKEKFFVFYNNGPFFVFNESYSDKKLLKFEVNQKNIRVKINNVENIIKSKFEKKNITIRHYEEKNFDIELEKKYLILKCGVLDINLIDNKNKHIKLNKRIKLIKSKLIKRKKKGFNKKDKNIHFINFEEKYSVFLDDYLHERNQGSFNKDYRNCNFLKSASEDNEEYIKLFLCISKRTNKLEVTDFKLFNLKLNIYEKYYDNATLLQIDDDIFLSFLNLGKRGIILFKFKVNNITNKNILVYKNQIFASEFKLDESYIEYFYMFHDKKNNSITYFIVNGFENKFFIRELGIDSNKILSKNTNEIFNYNKEKINYITCKNNEEKENFTCLIKSNNKILDLEFKKNLKYENNYWNYSINNIYNYFVPNKRNNNNIQIRINKKYFSIIDKNKGDKNYNILIYRRDKIEYDENNKLINQNIFGSIKQPDDTIFTKIALSDRKDDKSILYVLGFKNEIENKYNFYTDLIVNSYELNDLSLSVNLDFIKYKQALKFDVVYSDFSNEKFVIYLKDKKNFMKLFLIIALVLLVIIFLVLVVINWLIYVKNQSLKLEDEEYDYDRNHSMFLNGTILEI